MNLQWRFICHNSKQSVRALFLFSGWSFSLTTWRAESIIFTGSLSLMTATSCSIRAYSMETKHMRSAANINLLLQFVFPTSVIYILDVKPRHYISFPLVFWLSFSSVNLLCFKLQTNIQLPDGKCIPTTSECFYFHHEFDIDNCWLVVEKSKLHSQVVQMELISYNQAMLTTAYQMQVQQELIWLNFIFQTRVLWRNIVLTSICTAYQDHDIDSFFH